VKNKQKKKEKQRKKYKNKQVTVLGRADRKNRYTTGAFGRKVK